MTARLKSDDPIGVKEGYVEIFNMADIPPEVGTNALYTAQACEECCSSGRS
ncbi:MAG: hypothetical protein IPL70_12980 [Uliginosibacterium sp.]|nr:hypothetical protein [Uliginosibacterium sp.]